MTLEFVVITTGRFGSMERTLIITEALHAKVLRLFVYSIFLHISINFSVKPIIGYPLTPDINYHQYCYLY